MILFATIVRRSVANKKIKWNSAQEVPPHHTCRNNFTKYVCVCVCVKSVWILYNFFRHFFIGSSWRVKEDEEEGADDWFKLRKIYVFFGTNVSHTPRSRSSQLKYEDLFSFYFRIKGFHRVEYINAGVCLSVKCDR